MPQDVVRLARVAEPSSRWHGELMLVRGDGPAAVVLHASTGTQVVDLPPSHLESPS